jgi:hypothetical protein
MDDRQGVDKSNLHQNLACGGWYRMSLAEQLGNIGTEIARSIRAKNNGNRARFDKAVERSLELFDLTLSDPKLRGRYKEIARVREIFCDFILGDNVYDSREGDWDSYFLPFTRLARRVNFRADS